MILFGKLAVAAVCVCMAVFLTKSQFVLCKLALWKQLLLYGLCGAAIAAASLLADYFWLQAPVLGLCVLWIAWYAGGATFWKAALLGLETALLRLAAAGFLMFLNRVFPGQHDVCVLIMETLALYALVSVAAAFGQHWRATPTALLWLIPVCLVGCVLCAEIIRRNTVNNNEIPELMGILWLLYAGFRMLELSKVMERNVQANLIKLQKARHYAMQEEYFLQLQDKQKETRALWHDLNKYLRAAKAESESANALAQLEDMLSSATQIIDVGNRTLNVILHEYSQMAKAAGVTLRMKVQVPPVLPVHAADLYILIGNTMDNALEACGALPADDRVIDLVLRTHHDILYYRLMNPYTQQVKHPPDPMRGHGLQNVRRCLDKYSGSMDISQDSGFFILSAHMNLGPSEK